ncbi:NAD(P)/FAD-dependent oxidoreductase [Candidatus Peregrinibacteria bacterium]|nr:NAD(P)/FAD-dependent oxidoreductase [Candidatus Peregrinibacteria bacterium]
MKIAIVGGGAAGMMCAATLAEIGSGAEIFLIEKNAILGNKVIISGGGRCNVTTGIQDVKEVLKKYPRGKNLLKFALYNFPPKDVYEWFEEHGVPLKTEADLRVFPQSNNGRDVVKVFENIFRESGLPTGQAGVQILLKSKIDRVKKLKAGTKDEQFELLFNDGKRLVVDKVVITTGGQAYKKTGSTGDGYYFAETLGHTITPLAPSLNAFILKEKWVEKMAGVSFKKAVMKIMKKNFKPAGRQASFEGAFLFTHNGVTGPAVFALSSMAAFELADVTKPVKLAIDFLPEFNYQELGEKIRKALAENPKKTFVNTLDFFIPKSLAQLICDEVGIKTGKVNVEVAKAEINKAVELLKNMTMTVVGRAAGEEFVTAGGVNSKEINPKTMESKICPGLFFAGEILDIDGFTGGFNLQSAWCTGRLAGRSIGG